LSTSEPQDSTAEELELCLSLVRRHHRRRDAGEVIGEVSLAIRLGLGMRDLADAIHANPTQASAVRMAAIDYVRGHLTPSLKALRWLRSIRRAIRAGPDLLS
jgi:hypothetical protein